MDAYLMVTGTEAANQSEVAEMYGYPIGTWDVSQIQNFTRVFDPQRDIEFFDEDKRQIGIGTFSEDLDGWDLSNATTIHAMFAFATQFNGNISTWNVSGVTNATYLFSLENHLMETFHCGTQVSLSQCDVCLLDSKTLPATLYQIGTPPVFAT